MISDQKQVIAKTFFVTLHYGSIESHAGVYFHMCVGAICSNISGTQTTGSIKSGNER